ncbi:DNA primase [Parabacteroides sp. PFB2-12]|uniref:DNA primase n=1 Tax=unclassified Parabacteroides TaxID=2649774 RepID=UPI0024743E54|nr:MULTISPECIES: DNA primase [unclassified Parabacteroides]MDH6342670.1 DNA primase [Parabacteroides sp. PM6-13]MDH6389733.1 DNA primase [Parabacteroides sp. PFB2-12]
MIDQPTIDRILDAANIVDVVSEFVTLRRRGVNYIGLCPFHSDKTPSFTVSPAKNICKCFACGEGGSAVHFVMKHEQLTYFDALRFLAKKYNIEIQERELTEREKQVRSDRESMLIVNTWAQQYFSNQLFTSEEGRNIGLRYFKERGFREDIIRKFQLGYSLDKRDALAKEAIEKGYRKDYLEKTGLIIAYENGNLNDRFRGRVMFPVHTLSGKVVAFGGRTLKKDEKTAKYVNSPESEIYHKSNELYGIFFAKQPIVKADRCYLVEGYTDVISMHQAGIENVVASSGTALTQGQIRLIRRFTNNITVLYDGDAAGIKAALRGIDMLLEEGMNVKVLLLPNGEDPDSFARKHNATEFIQYIEKNETDFIRFKTQLLLDDAGHDPIKRSELISDIIRSVAIIPDEIARTVYLRECSSMLEVDERVILNEVNKIRQRNEERKAQQTPPSPPTIMTPPPEYPPQDMPPGEIPPDLPPEAYLPQGVAEATPPPEAITTIPVSRSRSPYEQNELQLLRYIVRYGEKILFRYKEEENDEEIEISVTNYIYTELAQDDLTFHTPLYKAMLDEAVAHMHDKSFTPSRYFLYHPDPNISQLAANLMSEKYQLSKYHTKSRKIEQEEDRLQQYVLKELFALKDAYINYKIKGVQSEIKEAQVNKDTDRIIRLMQQLTELNKIKSLLCKELGERIIIKM